MKTLLKIHTTRRLIALPLLLLTLTPTPAFAQDDDTIAEQRVALNWQVQSGTHSPENSDSLLDILQFLSSGILVLVGFWIQSLFTEKRRQKERADDVKRNRLVKLEELLREVGQLYVNARKLELAYFWETYAEQKKQKYSDPLLEIVTLTTIYFNELSEPVETLQRCYLQYAIFVQKVANAATANNELISDESIAASSKISRDILDQVVIVQSKCKKLAEELQPKLKPTIYRRIATFLRNRISTLWK